MKKSIRKLLALVGCLVLILSFSSVVSAATVTWEDAMGTYCVYTNISATLANQDERIKNLDTIYHRKGTPTAYPSGDPYVVTLYASYDKSVHANSYLIQAMEKDGVKASCTASGLVESGIGLPREASTGTYAMFMHFSVRSGSWYTVHNNLVAPSNMGLYALTFSPESGKIQYAPRKEETMDLLRIS